ncbi:MAG: pyridine nucleotide-disulfide oxidoreductase [Gammaproteobacteria bacterium]|nr:pyridine nucleotide-disulfide oxidoreductase [Gammaproteobacteria bacterium]
MDNFTSTHNNLQLGVSGYRYADLYDPHRLKNLFEDFNASLQSQDPDLFTEYQAYHDCKGEGMSAEAISDVLVKTSPYVSGFLSTLFRIETEKQEQADKTRNEVETIFSFKKLVASSKKLFRKDNLEDWDFSNINQSVNSLAKILYSGNAAPSDKEFRLATVATELQSLLAMLKQDGEANNTAANATQSIRNQLCADSDAATQLADCLNLSDPAEFTESLILCIQRWAHAINTLPEHLNLVRGWVSFKAAERIDFEHLVPVREETAAGYTKLKAPVEKQRLRDGFGLTDKRFKLRQVLNEVDLCKFCHDRDADACSKGMRNKKTNEFHNNPLDIALTGCPLEEKISEMHVLKNEGDNIAALALVVIDNPMCPGTGHRICNNCMKSCIFQKSQPVDIPQIETNVLTDVLFMPYGFEIYSLLTRWNPLNVKRPYTLPYNGKNVLVVGMGPAGYTLAHYLINEGFGVVGIDALKIEPLPESLRGNADLAPEPVKDFNTLYEDLDKRTILGFGGVAEYGITVRWDKNFLKVIYLTLSRRQQFSCYGGIRFGGTLTIEDAWELGFHHIGIAAGAGQPTVINLKNNLARGIRKASDFLMALQLTGAAKQGTLANLQMRLPAGIIGGGLTAVDTTTEAMAYYPIQVEKITDRYTIICSSIGEQAFRRRFDEEEIIILDEFLEHGKAIKAERERAQQVGEQPDFQSLVEKWGGVTLFYRKGMYDSPAYRQNHEEVSLALEERISWVEGMSPVEAITDDYGHLSSVLFDKLEKTDGRWSTTNQQIDVPLKSLYIAAGTAPNTIYEDEFPGTFEKDWKFFKRFELETSHAEQKLVIPPENDYPEPKIDYPAPLTSYQRDGKFISYYGDNHPVYAGNVVKAMASAKDGYPYIVRLFENELSGLSSDGQTQRDQSLKEFQQTLNQQWQATVKEVHRLTPTIIEIIVHAPMQARGFHPGQFYRVQNLDSLAPVVNGTSLTAEGLALTGAWVDEEQGLISLITLEMGSSSRLCAYWKPGDPVVVMGVTGTPTEIPRNKTICLVGGGLGNAVLFSIGKAMRSVGNKVIYFAGYKSSFDLFRVEDIEQASDCIVWSVDPGEDVEAIPTTRSQDKSFIGNILQAMEAYATDQLGEQHIPLNEADLMIVIGSDRMMAAVQHARNNQLKPYLKPEHEAVGSINSPMQCMMKGVCAQCMCKHIDPDTGEESFVYSCFNQDQNLQEVDFNHLHARLRQNSVHEKLSNSWLDHLLSEMPPHP